VGDPQPAGSPPGPWPGRGSPLGRGSLWPKDHSCGSPQLHRGPPWPSKIFFYLIQGKNCTFTHDIGLMDILRHVYRI
jgi:hypothetical protein